MKIDTELIKSLMMKIDENAKEDPEFLEQLDLFIYQLKSLQKQKNAKQSKKP